MDIEQTFAADIFNASGNAKRLTVAGLPRTVSDQVEASIAGLWMYAEAEGRSNEAIQEIVDRYTVEDDDGNRWPRGGPDNVTPLR